jgi:hypothetical protein
MALITEEQVIPYLDIWSFIKNVGYIIQRMNRARPDLERDIIDEAFNLAMRHATVDNRAYEKAILAQIFASYGESVITIAAILLMGVDEKAIREAFSGSMADEIISEIREMGVIHSIMKPGTEMTRNVEDMRADLKKIRMADKTIERPRGKVTVEKVIFENDRYRVALARDENMPLISVERRDGPRKYLSARVPVHVEDEAQFEVAVRRYDMLPVTYRMEEKIEEAKRLYMEHNLFRGAVGEWRSTWDGFYYRTVLSEFLPAYLREVVRELGQGNIPTKPLGEVLTILKDKCAEEGIAITDDETITIIRLLREFYNEEFTGKITPSKFIIALQEKDSRTNSNNVQIIKRAVEGAPTLRDAEITFVSDMDAFNERIAEGRVNGVFLDMSMFEKGTWEELQDALDEVTINASAILISSRSREELELILKEIAVTLDEIHKFDIDEAVRAQREVNYRNELQQRLAAQMKTLKIALTVRKEIVASTYNSMPLVNKAVLSEEPYAVITTEKVAFSDMFFANNMRKAKDMGIVNCFIYGEELKTEEDAKAFMRVSGYEGDLNEIKFINKKAADDTDLTYDEIIAAIKFSTGITVSGNIGIAYAEGELNITTAGERREKLFEMREIETGGVKVVASLNYYQTLLRMITTPEDLLNRMIVDKKLPPGVVYDDARRVFIYMPKALPIDYGKEIETYRNAINLIRTAV